MRMRQGRRSFLLSYNKSSWTIGCLQGGQFRLRQLVIQQDQDTIELLPEVAEALKELDYSGEELCLGIPSAAVVTAQIETTGLHRKHRQETLLYRLEEQLPLEAEQLTAGFIFPAVTPGKALGAAVQTKELAALLEQLENAGLQIDSICPTALLTLHEVLSSRKEPCDYCLIAGDCGMDVFRVIQGQLAAWHWCGAKPDDVLRSIQSDILGNPLSSTTAEVVTVGSLDPSIVAALEKAIPASIRNFDDPPIQAAAAAAREITAGGGAGWIDLRQGGLAPGSAWHQMQGLLKIAAILLLTLLASAAAMCSFRAWRYDAADEEFRRAQAAEYARVFPNRAVPQMIVSRFQSELAKLSGISGGDASLPGQFSGLDALRQIVKSLPAQIKLRLNEIRVAPAGALLEGQVLSHGDAAAIAEALSKAGLAAEPPRTEALPAGQFGFTITLKSLPQSRPSNAGGRP